MSDIQSIIEKVKKLLALANSNNANEAAIATAKANALIDQYRISIDQIGETADVPVTEDEPLYKADRAMAWRKLLAVKLSRHYGCFIWNHGHNGVTLRVAGRKSDIDVLRYMFAYITSECERIGVKECKGMGRRYAESYRMGFIDGVTSKLAESRKQAAINNGGETALVKLDDRAIEARNHVKQSVPLGRGKSIGGGALDGAAYGNGQRAGSSFHVGSSLGAGRTRMLGA